MSLRPWTRVFITSSSVTNSGMLKLNFNGTYTAGQKFVLIDAADGISGAFSSIMSQGASVVAGRDGTTFYVTVQ